MPALLLLTLLLAGLAIVLQGITGMLMLVLQRADLPVAVLQARFLVVVGLLQAGILDLGLLAQLLFLQQCLLGSLELLREPSALTFQLLDTAFGLPNLVLVIESFPCQLFALPGPCRPALPP